MKKIKHLMAALIFLIAATSCENTVRVEPMSLIDIPSNFKYTDQCANDWVQMARYQVYMDKLANDWNYMAIQLNIKMINAGCFEVDNDYKSKFEYQKKVVEKYLMLGQNLLELRKKYPMNSNYRSVVFRIFPELVKKGEAFGCVAPIQKVVSQMDDAVDRFNGVGSLGYRIDCVTDTALIKHVLAQVYAWMKLNESTIRMYNSNK